MGTDVSLGKTVKMVYGVLEKGDKVKYNLAKTQ